MLRSLYINNIAIISHLSVEFHAGMTSLTGETGAGKSIVIDSLALALGSRADQSLLRHGSEKAQVVAEFDISAYPCIISWLNKHDFELEESVCVLRRDLYLNKPSKSFINDRPITAQLLKSLGDQLGNIYGQLEHLNLTQPAKRLAIIDSHAQLADDLAKLELKYCQFKEIDAKITQLDASKATGSDEIDMLNFLIQELEQGNFSQKDYDQIDEEQKRLAHATQISDAVFTTLELLKTQDENNIIDSLNRSIKLLSNACKFDLRLNDAVESLTGTTIICEDVANELNQLAQHPGNDPNQLSEVEQRLGLYHSLARKHRCEPGDLKEKLDFLTDKLALIENRDAQLETLNKHRKKTRQEYQTGANKITMMRNKSAQDLSKAITTHMQQLNLKDGACIIECITDKGKISRSGQESIRFLVSTNKGQPAGAIEKVASGGELARISLAIALEVTRLSQTPVLVFDEVDAGISGETADLVGAKLRQLSAHAQVICITHLPQVASKAAQQLKVSKQADAKSLVSLTYLNPQERIEELARILSGKNITQESLANAKVMLQDAN